MCEDQLEIIRSKIFYTNIWLLDIKKNWVIPIS